MRPIHRLSLLPALVLALSPLLAAPAAQAKPETIDDAKEYQTCMTLAKSKPDDGWEESLAWASMGGGEPARHCGAIALIELGKYDEAGHRLEDLANETKRGDAIRAQMLAQAAQAWLLANNVDRADADQRAALKLAPDDPGILIDHAITLAQVHHYQDAINDLSQVLARQPNRIEALTLRASAYRYLGDFAAARTDIDHALQLDPTFPDALVERGILRRLSGDPNGARQDWLAVIRTVPSGPVLQEAQRNLELLDVKTK
jgi:tetratricopeptide (TPR) repeat protein